MSDVQELKLEKEVISFIEKAIKCHDDENQLDDLFSKIDSYITIPLNNINVKTLKIIDESGFFNSLLFPIGGDNAVSLMYELIKLKKFNEFLYFYEKSKYPNYWFRYNRDENDKAVKSFRVKDLMIATIRLLDQNKGFCVDDMLKTLSIDDIRTFSGSLRNYRRHFHFIEFYQKYEFERRHASDKDLEFIGEKYQHTHNELMDILDHFIEDVEDKYLTEYKDIMLQIQNSIASKYR